jgi:hypothetical protein
MVNSIGIPKSKIRYLLDEGFQKVSKKLEQMEHSIGLMMTYLVFILDITHPYITDP